MGAAVQFDADPQLRMGDIELDVRGHPLDARSTGRDGEFCLPAGSQSAQHPLLWRCQLAIAPPGFRLNPSSLMCLTNLLPNVRNPHRVFDLLGAGDRAETLPFPISFLHITHHTAVAVAFDPRPKDFPATLACLACRENLDRFPWAGRIVCLWFGNSRFAVAGLGTEPLRVPLLFVRTALESPIGIPVDGWSHHLAAVFACLLG